jgi:hypothetical protein
MNLEKQVFVNEKKRVIVTVLTDEYGNRFEGKAKCHPDDTFVQEIGENVSLKKAKINYNKAGITEAKEELKRVEKYAADLKKYITEKQSVVTTIKTSLDNYLKDKLS